MTDRIVLSRVGRERVTVTLIGTPNFSPAATVDVQMLGTSTWYPATVISRGDVLVAQLTVAGPSVDPVDAMPVTASGLFRVRVSDSGEVILRGGGYIALAA